VQEAVDKRAVDKSLLLRVAVGRFCCTFAIRLLSYVRHRLATPLDMRIKKYYSVLIFRALARLDVPTFDDPIIERQIERAYSRYGRSSIAWETVVMAIRLLTTTLQLVSQVAVLIGVLQDQRDGPLLAVLCFSSPLLHWLGTNTSRIRSGGTYSFAFRSSSA
jgi:hypothetical protein